jgi:hypothetical protein
MGEAKATADCQELTAVVLKFVVPSDWLCRNCRPMESVLFSATLTTPLARSCKVANRKLTVHVKGEASPIVNLSGGD